MPRSPSDATVVSCILKGYGTTDYATGAPAVDASTMYDLASLTKVVATTTAAMILEEEGKLDISRTVQSYLPEFNAPDKASITVRMLLTHRGGLEAFAPLWKDTRGRADYLTQINARPLMSTPGTKMVYSDWDFILMQDVIERITGTTLDAFVAARVFGPLGMTSTRFLPDTTDAALMRRIAPTELDSLRGQIHGTVHDPNAWALGGVSGHAGLFSTARDLADLRADAAERRQLQGHAHRHARRRSRGGPRRRIRTRAARSDGTRRRTSRAPAATSRRAASGTPASPARPSGSIRSAGCS